MLGRKPRVGLFVTCLVDLVRPSIGFAAVKLLERAGCAVEVPPSQTCCGQPAYQFRRSRRCGRLGATDNRRLRRHGLSRRPLGLLRRHDPQALSAELFQEGSDDRFRAEALAPRSHELVSFLVDVMGDGDIEAKLSEGRDLSRQLLGPARARHPQPAAPASGQGQGPGSGRDEGCGGLLRLRRHVLRQVSGHLQQDGGARRPPHWRQAAPTR